MQVFESLLTITHVGFGFLGLVFFWFPVFSRKGGKVHRTMGQAFYYCGMIVVGSAGISVVYHLLKLYFVVGVTPENTAILAFLVLLGYLAFITWASLYFGRKVLTHRTPDAMRNGFTKTMIALLPVASLGLIVATAILQPQIAIVLYVLSPIGFIAGWEWSRFLRGTLFVNADGSPSSQTWLYRHIDAMIGAGIAFHTAFAVFGVTRLIDYSLPGVWQIVPWVLPAAIGVPASMWTRRKYQRKFAGPAQTSPA